MIVKLLYQLYQMEHVNKFIIIILFFSIVLVNSSTIAKNIGSDFVTNLAIEQKLYNTKKWKSLLHVDGKKSIINDKKFFLSIDGQNNIKEELAATIRAFFETKNLGNEHAICRFPARFDFVLNSLDLDKNIFPKVDCKELKGHIEKISPQKISLSFASENITSPMSMMGHLFIKVSGYDKDGKLVEHALSYFAQHIRGTSEMKFYFDSMFNGSNGVYFLTPYREKLIEYNDRENRNIWNYDLNLTEKQVLEFVYHTWEIRDIKVPYNFFMHNCGTASIYMLASIDDKFYNFFAKKFWLTPLDSLKKLYGMNMISDISIYPSDSYKIKMFQDNFSFNEKRNIKKFIETNNLNHIINTNNKNNALFMSEIIAGNEFLNKKISLEEYRNIQKTIAENFDGVLKVTLKQKNKIQLNNPFSSGIRLSYGEHKKDNILDLSFYPVYRNLNDDNSQNFNEFNLELLKLNAYYNFDDNKLHSRKIYLIDLKSLTPSDYFLPSWSFSFNIGLEETEKLQYDNMHLKTEGGIGKTYSLHNSLKTYFMLHSGYFEKLYLMPEVGFIFSISNRSKTIFSYNYFIKEDKYLDYKILVSQNFYLNDRFAFNFDYEYNRSKKHKSYSNLLGGIKFYF